MVIEEVLIARKRTIESVAVPLCGLMRSSSCIARIPKGVAALPSPITLADKFIIIAPIAGCPSGTSGNKRTKIGLISLAMIVSSPPFSATFIKPKKSAITPMRPNTRVTESLAESMIPAPSACIAVGVPAITVSVS